MVCRTAHLRKKAESWSSVLAGPAVVHFPLEKWVKDNKERLRGVQMPVFPWQQDSQLAYEIRAIGGWLLKWLELRQVRESACVKEERDAADLAVRKWQSVRPTTELDIFVAADALKAVGEASPALLCAEYKLRCKYDNW